MNLLPLVMLCVGLVTAGVKREAGADAHADADADADAQLLYGHKPLAVHQPECHSVPETTCVPRQVEIPRKVCHQEFDEIIDTIVTEHCEEVITTTCQQVTTKAIHTKALVGEDSQVVATGVDPTPPVTVSQGAPQPGAVGPPASVVGAPHHHHGSIGPVGPGGPIGPVGPGGAIGPVGPGGLIGPVGHGAAHHHPGAAHQHPGALGLVGHGAPHHHLGKRDADAVANAEAEALADADPHAEADADADAHPPHPFHPPPVEVIESPPQVSHPQCHSVPVKHCENIPTHTPRRVARTICAVHVDITTIEDCEEVITTKCHQTSQSVAHASNVVGHDTRVGPPVVAGHHPVPTLGGPHAAVGPVGPLPLLPPLAPLPPAGYAGPALAPVLPVAPILPLGPGGYAGPPLAPVLQPGGFAGPPLAPVLQPGAFFGPPIARSDSPLDAFKAMIHP